VATTEPERELIRRVLPFALPSIALAYAAGALASAGAARSAAIAVAVVVANFVAHGLSLAWAARISPTVLVGVGLGGFAVRIGAILVALLLLDRISWFSPVAFAAALVPSTVALLAFEAKVLSGRLQSELWRFPAGPTGVRR
jgi:ATP synthase protein I